MVEDVQLKAMLEILNTMLPMIQDIHKAWVKEGSVVSVMRGEHED